MLNNWLPDWLYTFAEVVILMFAFGTSGLVIAVLIADTFDKDCEGLYEGSIRIIIVAILLALMLIALMVVFGEIRVKNLTRC